MPTILHLMPLADWQALADDEPITNPSLDGEGFIHCTDDPAVMLQVANAFYRGRPEAFVVIHVDADRLSSACRWEAPAHVDGSTGPGFASTFPHVYGPIDRASVVGVQSVDRDADGRFTGYGAVDT